MVKANKKPTLTKGHKSNSELFPKGMKLVYTSMTIVHI
jgi:hypothetical protein